MANIVFNYITISGKTEDVISVFNNKFFKDFTPQGDVVGYLRRYLSSHRVSLRSWMPMPKTFVDFDTTNHKKNRDSLDYSDPKNKPYPPMFNSDEEYEKYSKGYDNAVKYQKRKYGCVGWYDYNLKILGCKWDSLLEQPVVNEKSDGTVSVTFSCETPWSNPVNWFARIIDMYPKVQWEMDSEEEMGGFHDVFKYDPVSRGITLEEIPMDFEEYEDEVCVEVEDGK